jgi:hypothetical protein
MLGFDPCNIDRVEGFRTLLHPLHPASVRKVLLSPFECAASATGEIFFGCAQDKPRDACSTKRSARRGTGARFALEMTPLAGSVSFRARASGAYRGVRVTTSAGDREESCPVHSHTLSMRRAKLSASVISLSVVADGPSTTYASPRGLRQTVQKSRYQKDARSEPIRRNREHF